MDKMFDDMTKECARPKNTPVDAALAYRDHPESFDGLSPKSKYWPEVEASYRRYQQRTCNYATPQSFAHHFAQQLAERISEDDLRTSIDFYSSSASRRIQDATVEINIAFQAYATRAPDEKST
jgi:hypothetical protein